MLWPNDKKSICEKIRRRSSVLKIILKTKDESMLLPIWLKHHLQIVDPSDILIIDNSSSNEDVLEIYNDQDRCPNLFRYAGQVDDLHHVRIFHELYEAIRESSNFFVALDTDELLYVCSGNRIISDRRIPRLLARHPECVHPGVWLNNYPGCTSIFFAPQSTSAWAEALRWGKPIISSKISIRGFINHNVQLYRECGPLPLWAGVFIAHLTRLDPKQRIDSNLRKMKSLGLLPRDLTFEKALQLFSNDRLAANAQKYSREILSLLPVLNTGWSIPGHVPDGCIQLVGERFVLGKNLEFDFADWVKTNYQTHAASALQGAP